MIAMTLQRLIDQRQTSAKEISELTGVAASTVYRWINGTSDPDFNAIRLLVKHLPSVEAQHALLTVFLAGTHWQCVPTAMDLDLNKDGRVDHDDALAGSIQSVRSASETLTKLHQTFERLPLDKGQTSVLLQMLNDVIHHCTSVQHILLDMISKRERKQLNNL